MIQAYSWLLILPLPGQCHFMQQILLFPSDTEKYSTFLGTGKITTISFKGLQYACVASETTGTIFVIIGTICICGTPYK